MRNYKLAKYTRNLISIENQIIVHRQIVSFSHTIKQSGISQLSIPTDPKIDWNRIPKAFPKANQKIITEKKYIERNIIKRNINNLNQAPGTVCTIHPIQSLLGYDSFTSFGNDILTGKVNFSNTNLNYVQKISSLSLNALFFAVKTQSFSSKLPLIKCPQVSQYGKRKLARLLKPGT